MGHDRRSLGNFVGYTSSQSVQELIHVRVTFLGSYDRDPWSEQRCAHRRSDTIFSGGGTNDKDG